MDKLIDELLERNNYDPRQTLAWVLGCINNLEKQRNESLSALGFSTEQTLLEDLEEGSN